jgi:site-specific DNA-methyltransferase (adenine-specific)
MYKIILADPPWAYNDKTPRGGAEKHYSTMSTADICKLPIQTLADPDCALFMWGTYPKLADALQVMAAWGFEYKTLAFQWVKTYKNGTPFWGLGRWTRANTEPCFLAVRGKPKRLNMGVHQLIMSQIRKHSEKPPEVRDRIKLLLGDLPAVELFARQQVPGWDSWGNQVESTPTMKDLLG